MSRVGIVLGGVAAFSLVFVGCSWNRFTKLKEDTPVFRLEAPEGFSGAYAAEIAVAESEDRAEIYLGGREYAQGGLVYSLGVDEDPQPNPTDETHCRARDGRDRCSAVRRPAGLSIGVASSEEHELCFVSGLGTVSDNLGLWTRCDDRVQFVYPLPGDVQTELSIERDEGPDRELRLATNRGPGPQVLAAAARALGRAWYYPAGDDSPISLETPSEAGGDFGGDVTVAALDGPRFLIAVSAPDQGELWLYLAEGDTPSLLGCVVGAEGFGRTLGAGDVDGDGEEDIVVADEEGVTVFSGAVIAESAASGTGSCSEVDLGDAGVLVEITCESTADTTGCGASQFGAALAVADVDGDGAGEIFVGAPKMAAREIAQAGAVLAYDGEGNLLAAQIVSDGEEGDEFGASLAAISQGSRDIVVVGAVEASEAYLLYCAGKSDGDGSPRCRQP